jgi:RNA polymerase sigma-70 factor (ECF subfamily)
MTAFGIGVAHDLSEPEAPSTQEAAIGRATAADLSLLARLRAGDEAALVELVYGYQAALLRLAMVFVENRALAEEVVQETWTGVLEGIAYFEGHCRIKTCIFGILIKRARLRVIRDARSVPFSSLRHS